MKRNQAQPLAGPFVWGSGESHPSKQRQPLELLLTYQTRKFTEAEKPQPAVPLGEHASSGLRPPTRPYLPKTSNHPHCCHSRDQAFTNGCFSGHTSKLQQQLRASRSSLTFHPQSPYPQNVENTTYPLPSMTLEQHIWSTQHHTADKHHLLFSVNNNPVAGAIFLLLKLLNMEFLDLSDETHDMNMNHLSLIRKLKFILDLRLLYP